jgi:outer membrane protein assembly factor BamB
MVGAFGTDGRLQWIAQFGSAGAETVTGIVADGSIVYVTGTTDGGFGTLLEEDGGPGGATDLFLTALDAVTGELLWSSRLGTEGDDRSTGITTTEDGLLVVSGTTTGQFADTPPNGGIDGILVAFPLASAGGGAASSV